MEQSTGTPEATTTGLEDPRLDPDRLRQVLIACALAPQANRITRMIEAIRDIDFDPTYFEGER